MKPLDCPANFVSVNQTKVRLTALLVFVSSLSYLVTPHWGLSAFLVVDFFLRGFNGGRYSFFAWAGHRLVRRFGLPVNRVDSAPKVFAAQLGFVIADSLFILSCFGLYTVGFYFAVLLVCFSFLEAFFGFCAGCYVYSLVKKAGIRGGAVSAQAFAESFG